jgi:hypothetical protein
LLNLSGDLTGGAEIPSIHVRLCIGRQACNRDIQIRQRCLGGTLEFLSFLLARPSQLYNLAEQICRMPKAARIVLSQTLLGFGKKLLLTLALGDHLIEKATRVVFSPATLRQSKDLAKVALGLCKPRTINLRFSPAKQFFFPLQ